MARIARLIVPNLPHHVIQRGNRKQKVFFSDHDRHEYLKLLAHYAEEGGLTFAAWCLMSNHVHFICIPAHEDSVRQTFSETHRRYSRMINFRQGWRGYLWQGRFLSYVLNEKHLYAAIRYVELNPVKAGLVSRAEDYEWSSAKSHVMKNNDILCSKSFLNDEIQDWKSFLNAANATNESILFEKHARTGRPLGNVDFIKKLENMTGRTLLPKKPGPKPLVKHN